MYEITLDCSLMLGGGEEMLMMHGGSEIFLKCMIAQALDLLWCADGERVSGKGTIWEANDVISLLHYCSSVKSLSCSFELDKGR